jgi:hypothetical protein
MNFKVIASTLVALLLVSSPAFAHDTKSHKGPMVEGKLTLLQNDRAEIQTEKGKTLVIFVAETKFETGMDGKAGTRSDLKVGQNIMISGHKLESGEFAATEIMIHDAHAGEPEEHHHKE